MSTLTKEWLLKTIAELEEERDAVPGAVNEDAAMALEAMKLALASLEAEPVGYFGRFDADDEDLIDQCSHNISGAFPLYSVPPAPVALPVQHWEELCRQNPDMSIGDAIIRAAWRNHCAAMLQGAEPVTTTNKLPEETGSSLQLRNLIRQRHAEWSQATFGDVGPVGPLKHLSKEALEAAEEPDDLSEWADMQFLLWDAQRRAGISDGEITAAMEEKLKVNMARQWPEPKDGEPRLHIKAAPQQEVK